MKTTYFLTATAAVMLLASSAFAATMTPAAQCTALQKQWDQSITQHSSASKVKEARALHTDGVKLCSSGKSSDGVAKLEQAIKDLGVKPQV
jgi:hypothetical protein